MHYFFLKYGPDFTNLVLSATGSSAEPTKPLDHIKLPSLLESEDSELDETLEDIWIRGKYLLTRKGSAQRTIASASST